MREFQMEKLTARRRKDYSALEDIRKGAGTTPDDAPESLRRGSSLSFGLVVQGLASKPANVVAALRFHSGSNVWLIC
jgi:hypothetical protein